MEKGSFFNILSGVEVLEQCLLEDAHAEAGIFQVHLWASTFRSNKVEVSYIGLTSYEIVLLRSLLGSILLIVVFFLTEYKLTALYRKKDFCYIALSGITMGADLLLLFKASGLVVNADQVLWSCI